LIFKRTCEAIIGRRRKKEKKRKNKVSSLGGFFKNFQLLGVGSMPQRSGPAASP
jgi:hypothetical protein